MQLFYPFSCYDPCLASMYASKNAVLEHPTICSSLTAIDQVSCPNGIDRIMGLLILMFAFLDRIRKDLSPNSSELSSNLLCIDLFVNEIFVVSKARHTIEVTLF